MSERVKVTIADHVADVRMSRPEKMNAIDADMFAGLTQAGLELRDNPAVRAVVLSGEGRAFCAGLDFTSFRAMAEREDRSTGGLIEEQGQDSPANRAQRAAFIWNELPVPVIAAVHGVAFGGGLQIALGADIRFVAPDARLSVMEVRWGLVPDMSGTQTLRRLARLDVVKELTFTGRIVSGVEAVELGLATHVAEDPYAAAMALAKEIAQKSPDAVRAAKKLLNASGLVSLAEGLKLEADLQRSVIGKPNQAEAARANLENRPPKFVDPE